MNTINLTGKKLGLILIAAVLILVIGGGIGYALVAGSPQNVLKRYYSCIEEKDYEKMYQMLDESSQSSYSEEKFIERNSAIFEGIEASDIKVAVQKGETKDRRQVSYKLTMSTVAGKIRFKNVAYFVRDGLGYKLKWSNHLIHPLLKADGKIRVSAIEAERGAITDRNGTVLAGKGTAISVGVIPGKLEENSLERLAEALGMEPEMVKKKCDASWVKDTSFVPIQTRKDVSDEMNRLPEYAAADAAEAALQSRLLEIPGVMLSTISVRSYPMGAAAAHLVGYMQRVNAEDLEEHKDEGYTANSMIGRSGLEFLYEKKLKGKNGIKIFVADVTGSKIKTLAEKPAENGKDLRLTIDADLQNTLYHEFQSEPGCSAALDPYTGEVLALVSTPSYDSNQYILGMSTETWDSLNNDEKRPLYNRFRQTWCPGSTFKPITGSIGLEEGAMTPDEDYGSVGMSWQKNSTWGSYKVTTLHTYTPVILKNALIYSDNIYFAKTALKIGSDSFESRLKKLGFNKELPFELSMNPSSFSNKDHISGEIQLADSGYGQGQMLVNPLHLAVMYTAFLNEGNIVKPHLLYNKNQKTEFWIENAFSKETADTILDGLKQVVSSEHGTAHAAYDASLPLAGKTGTAELKAAKGEAAEEIGWFASMTTDRNIKQPVLLVSMVQDVSGSGGSGYVVRKDKSVLDRYCK